MIFRLKVVKIQICSSKTIEGMISGAKVVNMTTLIGPKRAHKQQTHIFATYFEIQDANQKLNNPPRHYPPQTGP